MEEEKPTIDELKKADPRQYAELCVKAGFYKEAFGYYEKSNKPDEVVIAARLAKRLGKKRQVRDLCEKARKLANEELVERVRQLYSPAYGGDRAHITSQNHRSARRDKNRVYGETSELLLTIQN